LRQTRQWEDDGIVLHQVETGGTVSYNASAISQQFNAMKAGLAESKSDLPNELHA